jgi:hypothetical protein
MVRDSSIRDHIALLDLKSGLSTSQFVEVDGDGDHNDGGEMLHTREWFVDSLTGVLTGRISCVKVSSKTASTASKPDDHSSSCLDLNLKVTRVAEASEEKQPTTKYATRGGGVPGDNAMQRQVVTIGPSQETIVPHTVMCVSLACDAAPSQQPGSVGGSSAHATSKKGKLLQCSGNAQVYVAVEREEFGTDNLSSKHDYSDEKLQKMEERCWNKISAISALSFSESRQAQEDHFGGTMRSTELKIATTGSTDGDGIRSTSSFCRHIENMFVFGKYLMLSSGDKYTSNLQGVWADGPNSAWSGDYHLNINMQMNHWGSAAVGLGHITSPPLASFMRRLRASGTRTAKQFYQCPGWVAHGFTDEYMDTGTAADYHWAFCVTCGAWTALSLWEYLTFLPVQDAAHGGGEALRETVSSLSGIADFFLEYFATDAEGHKHTGPTTSPENSYLTLNPRYNAPPSTPGAPAEIVSAIHSDHRPSDIDLEKLLHHPELDPELDMDLDMDMDPEELDLEREAAAAGLHARNLVESQSSKSRKDKPATKSQPKKQKQQKYLYTQLAMSPAIDVSILRQAALAYEYTLDSSFVDALNLSAEDVKTHRERSKRFADAVASMPNGALPAVDKESGYLFEYSAQFLGEGSPGIKMVDTEPSVYGKMVAAEPSSPAVAREQADSGHRHFSGMHFLYPNTFAPRLLSDSSSGSASNDALKKGAEATLKRKREDGGGHAGWSAAWESALWARLGAGDDAWTALKRFIAHYTTPRYLGLHPRLQPTIRDCKTCFRDPGLSNSENGNVGAGAGAVPAGRSNPRNARGLSTLDESLFQIDGNFGLLAGVAEMLVQSHTPGYLQLLPALPREWYASGPGHMKGLQARGDVTVSVCWDSQGSVAAATLRFASAHPWNSFGRNKIFQGFNFRYNHHRHNEDSAAAPPLSSPGTARGENVVIVASPSPLREFHHESTCASVEARSGGGITIKISTYPCEVRLCGAEQDDVSCEEFLRRL